MDDLEKQVRSMLDAGELRRAVVVLTEHLAEQPNDRRAQSLLMESMRAVRERQALEAEAALPPDYGRRVFLAMLSVLMPVLAALWVLSRLNPDLVQWLAPAVVGGLSLVSPLAMLLPLPDRHPRRSDLDSLIHLLGLVWLAGSMLYLLAGGPRGMTWLLMLCFLAASSIACLLLAYPMLRNPKPAPASPASEQSRRTGDQENKKPTHPDESSIPTQTPDESPNTQGREPRTK